MNPEDEKLYHEFWQVKHMLCDIIICNCDREDWAKDIMHNLNLHGPCMISGECSPWMVTKTIAPVSYYPPMKSNIGKDRK